MAAFTDAVLADGRIDLTEDGAACALWLPVPADGQTGDESGEDHREGADDGPGPGAGRPSTRRTERVELIARLTDGIHPSGRAHEYLWMIGVTPDSRGRGPGHRAHRVGPRPLRP